MPIRHVSPDVHRDLPAEHARRVRDAVEAFARANALGFQENAGENKIELSDASGLAFIVAHAPKAPLTVHVRSEAHHHLGNALAGWLDAALGRSVEVNVEHSYSRPQAALKRV